MSEALAIDTGRRPTQTGVPVRLTSFVGRDAECAELAALLGGERLVTVAGPGGCGKTSLAAAAATSAQARFADGIGWVGLGPVTDVDGRVAYATLAALGVGDLLGMDPVERIISWLAQRSILLVLDNCEHLGAETAKLAAQVVAACPAVHVLVTSREPLGVDGELLWRLGPLRTPAPDEVDPAAVLATEAGRLFADRGAEALRGFRVDATNAADVAALCARLDGLPLAIELAAARVRSLSPDRILVGLDQRFRLLTGGQAGAFPHQQTLAASVEWSFALLTDLERVLLRRLAVFPGSFTLEAAEEIVSDDLLGRWDVLVLLSDLVERSLVIFDGSRYRLLTTIREFAAAAVDAAGEGKSLRGAHLTHYAALAAEATAELAIAPRLETLNRLDVEYDNLQAAISEALAAGADAVAVALVADLTLWWMMRGHYAEAHVWFGRVLAEVPSEPAADLGWALWGVGLIGLFSMDVSGGFGMVETAQALEIATASGNDRLLGRALARSAVFNALVAPAAAPPALADAVAISQRAGDPFGVFSAHAYASLALIFSLDDPEPARPHLAALAAAGGPYWACWHELCTGIHLLRTGELAHAREALEACWAHADAVGDPMLESWASTFLAEVHTALGDTAAMDAVVTRSASLQVASAYARAEFVLSRRVDAAIAAGDGALARRCFEPIRAVLLGCGIPFVLAEVALLTGRVALLHGDAAAAADSAAAAGALVESFGTPWYAVRVADLTGRVALASGSAGGAEDAQQRALALCARHGFTAAGADTMERLAHLAAAGESATEATRLFGAAAALRARTGRVRDRADEAAHGADLTYVQNALGAAAFAQAWAQGEALDLAAAAAYAARARGERKRPSSGWASLTPTERQVVDLVAEGLGNAGIAERLFVTTATAKTHLHHVFTKLGVANRTQLAATVLARRHDEPKKADPARP